MSIHTAAVIGGGSFGTVVANILADNHIATVQWMRNEEVAASINNQHEKNPVYLPGGVSLNPALRASTGSTWRPVQECGRPFLCRYPANPVREVVAAIAPHLRALIRP